MLFSVFIYSIYTHFLVIKHFRAAPLDVIHIIVKIENPFAGEHFVSEKYLIFRMMDANMAYRYYSSIHFIINGNNKIEKEFSSLYFKRKKFLKRHLNFFSGWLQDGRVVLDSRTYFKGIKGKMAALIFFITMKKPSFWIFSFKWFQFWLYIATYYYLLYLFI